ncbi:hypothetical protein [Saccharicrinis aurantiacus]|uniref:hypothetical protein n=1 Tax=Saccharicrinis aurantiacus TaxID=1849719 RepID=UPI000950267A|nr:hypothetical protein [Saccharicrinis aurantiacus]
MKYLVNLKLAAIALLALFVTACNDDSDGPNNGGEKETVKTNHITARFDGDDAQVYIAPADNLEEGSLTFKGNGYHLNPVRSARVFTDNTGWVYVFDYGGGYLKKLSYKDGTYTQVRELDIAPVMGGNPHVRPWKINEQSILIHNINTEDVEDPGNGITKKGSMYVTRVQIPEVVISEIMETWTLPVTDWDIDEQSYPFRIDAPTVLDDKIYYGVGRRQLDESIDLTGIHTIVLDYPTLKNPKYIRSEKANGNTNGYRGENMHAIDGYVYQANRSEKAEDATVIVRLKDGEYDDSWEFNVSEELGMPFNSNNWYHVGNGICYMSAEFFSETDENNTWGVVRIDMNQKTAIKMNVPLSDLFAYQHGIDKDGKFYMAISPVGSSGESDPYVYIFDIDSTDPDAFETGLSLDKGNIFIEGIF